MSSVTQEPGRGQQEICVWDSFEFCHLQRSESNLGTSESSRSISPEGFLQTGKGDQRREVKMGKALNQQWRTLTSRAGGGSVNDNLLCFQTFLSLPHPFLSTSCPHLPSFLSVASSLAWPVPSRTGTGGGCRRCCWLWERTSYLCSPFKKSRWPLPNVL